MCQIHFPVLEDAFADGALIVFVLEAGLLVESHVSLRRAQVLASAVADGARQVFGVQVRVGVVLAHVQTVVALEAECLGATIGLL